MKYDSRGLLLAAIERLDQFSNVYYIEFNDFELDDSVLKYLSRLERPIPHLKLVSCYGTPHAELPPISARRVEVVDWEGTTKDCGLVLGMLLRSDDLRELSVNHVEFETNEHTEAQCPNNAGLTKTERVTSEENPSMRWFSSDYVPLFSFLEEMDA
jgi:hypothetical protein